MKGKPQYALVVGKGAREHAIVLGLVESGRFEQVYAAPGNPGISQLAQCVPWQNTLEIVAWTQTMPTLLVVIGPENPLAEGLADSLRAQGHWVVGPSQGAARLESSKAFAKSVMERYGIPTPRAERFYTIGELRQAIDTETRWPHVIKQSGLAGGKGVVVVESAEHARSVASAWARQPEVFSQGVLWEDYLVGEEISVHVLTNGQGYVWLPLTRDYKRVSPAPDAPNTGGMGAYGPVTDVSATVRSFIDRRVLEPIMQFLQDDSLLYRGVLYVGLMLTADGPMVLEFNVRMGDPETEVLIPLVDHDWGACWMTLSQGELPIMADQPSRAAVAVVLADSGYPVSIVGSQEILLPPHPQARIFHGATSAEGDRLVGQGGRILTVVGTGATIGEARNRAYHTMERIVAENTQYRLDIAIESTRIGE